MTPSIAEAPLRSLVRRAAVLADRAAAAGGLPFSALVVDASGTVLGQGVNEESATRDPTAHAEVLAVRRACRTAGTTAPGGMTLIASGEPCAMCYVVARQAGIGRIVFAVDRHGAARAGFDYTDSYGLLAVDPRNWPVEVSQVGADLVTPVFERWRRSR